MQEPIVLATHTNGRGVQVVFVHGVGVDSWMWTYFVEQLQNDYRITTLDLPGHGASPAAKGFTLSDLADAVAGVISDGPAHVVGFSVGALTAQLLAIRHPDKVRSLVLLSSVAERTSEQTQAVQGRLAMSRVDLGALSEETPKRWVSEDWAQRDPDITEAFRRKIASVEHASYQRCYELLALGHDQVADGLGGIEVPVLVMTGEFDAASTPHMARQLEQKIPGARAVVVPGTRHMMPLEKPDVALGEIRAHLAGAANS